MKTRWSDYLYLVTILFFALGIFNIIFAWIAIFCITLPFVFAYKDGKKTYCHKYCGREKLLLLVFRGKKNSKVAPKWILSGWFKSFILYYFYANVIILFMSTIMVFLGRMYPMDMVRFMIVYELPFQLPQLIQINIPDWATHLSFRFYSMMFSTTLIGLILGLFYKPRTWCTVCPINQLTTEMIKKK